MTYIDDAIRSAWQEGYKEGYKAGVADAREEVKKVTAELIKECSSNGEQR